MYKRKLNLLELKNKEWWILHLPIISFFLISIVYFIVACYKLTYAALWYDEAVEFYYSRHIFASEVPGYGIRNMYQRIISTFQPPLYNFLMFFWLRISESEWWFRFAGVVAGYCGSIGIYKTIKQYCNWKWATLSMFAFFSIYHVLYYIQECAEYILLLAFIPWTVYFFLHVLANKSWKNIILFIVFSILPIYSQYGAAFAVIPMLLLVFIDTVFSKDWNSLKKLSIGYICALIFAAIPLYVFFLKPQIANQPVKTISSFESFFYNNVLYDFFKSFFEVFKWNIISPNIWENPAIVPLFTVFIFFFIILCCYILLKSKNKILKYLVISNIITLCLYYFAVKTKIYAFPVYVREGWNGFFSRYGLFFIPLWVSSFFYIAYNSFRLFQVPKSYKKIFLVFILFFCVCGIIQHWQHGKKADDMRGVVDCWYSLEKTRQEKTILIGHGCGSFYYYFTHHKKFNKRDEKNIKYKENILKKTYIDNFLSTEKLNSCFVAVSRLDEINYSRESAAKYGYSIETIYSDRNTALLFLTRTSK